jgi:hypothetical protein
MSVFTCTSCFWIYASTSASVQYASGATFTLPRAPSKPTTGVLARLGPSSRRSPAAQAS